ncbi:MAG: sensor protein FixL [Planctomycetota bacterium]|jgi:signal transduction histidine kinase
MSGFQLPHDQDRLADLGRMAGALAHEIKNPLGVVVMNADLVLAARPAGIEDAAWERLQARMRRIREAAANLQGTVQGFLAYAKPDRPDPQPVDVNEVLAALVEELSEGFAAEDIEIAFHPEGAMLLVPADRAHLRSVFLNILLNARDALRERDGERRIWVVSRAGQGTVRTVIANNGPPLPERVAMHLFQPFVSGKEHGTGLGLAIVRRLVELHRGTVKVSSDPAQGVSFAIELPTHLGPVRPRLALTTAAKAPRRRKAKA